MCGRYTLYDEMDEINAFLNTLSKIEDFESSFNVAPTHEMPVAFVNEEGDRVLHRMHWGFMGWKPGDGKSPFLPVNTRDDSLTKKPMWKKAFRERRCLVPANGFYEWTGKKGHKTPHYIHPKENSLMAFAGIYSGLAPEDKGSGMSYSIITTSPNKLMEDIHDRMPAILHPEEFGDWLNPEHSDPNFLKDFIQPYPDDALEEHIVSKAVGNVRNNSSGFIEKADLFG